MRSEAQKRADKKYRQSEKGKATQKKYLNSEKGKEIVKKCQKEYIDKNKEHIKEYYREYVKEYVKSEKGKEARKKYRQTSEVYRQRHLEAVKRYNEKKKAEKLAMKGSENNAEFTRN